MERSRGRGAGARAPGGMQSARQAQVAPAARAGRGGRIRPPREPDYFTRYQSATFHSSLSQVFSTTPPSELECADTRPRSTSGMIV